MNKKWLHIILLLLGLFLIVFLLEWSSIFNTTISSDSIGFSTESTQYKGNAKQLKELVQAEDQRDLPKILSHFAPYIDRYWHLYNIDQVKLESLYYQNWSKITKAQNTILAIETVNDFECLLETEFRFTTIATQEESVVQSKIRFVFFGNGKITQVYKVE